MEVSLDSHRAYLGEYTPVTIQTTSVLKQFGSNPSVARRGYLSFMKEGLGQGHLDRLDQTVEQRFLGDERFVNEVEKKTRETEPAKVKVSFTRLVEGVASVYRIEAGRLLGTERKRSWVEPRSLLVYAAREWCGIKAKVLAEHLHRDASMISRCTRRMWRNGTSDQNRSCSVGSTSQEPCLTPGVTPGRDPRLEVEAARARSGARDVTFLGEVRKMTIRISLIFSALVFALSAGTPANGAEKLRVAYPTLGPGSTPSWVTHDAGFWKKSGLDVELILLSGGARMLPALVSGSVEIILGSDTGVTLANLQGANLVRIGVTMNSLGYSLVTQPGIRSIQDLKGKVLGTGRGRDASYARLVKILATTASIPRAT